MPALCARDAYMVIRVALPLVEMARLGSIEAQGHWLCDHGWIPTYGGPHHVDMTQQTTREETRPVVIFEQTLWRVHLTEEDDDDDPRDL